MSKKKKVIILSCMIALLAVTAVFNFVFTTDRVKLSEPVNAGAANYFVQYKTERLNTRNEELLQLDAIIESAQENSPELAQALAMKIELTKNTEREMLIESLIKAYGFEDAVVIIGMDSDNVNVMAKTDNLTADNAIVIQTIISEEVNISPENVKIIPIS